MRNNKKLTTIEFIAAATAVHGDLYDYSKTEYLGSTTPLTIVCRQHGEFQQLPYVHLRGSGCALCVQAKRVEEAGISLLAKLRNWHKDRYDLSKIIYTGVLDPVTLGCAEHGDFSLTPASLLARHGCPACGIASRAKKVTERTGWAITTDEFIQRCRKVHGEKYDYSVSQFSGRDKHVVILCPEHGQFTQTAIMHLSGQGCPVCGAISSRNNRAYTTEEFLERVRPEYLAKYDFSLAEYNRGTDRIRVLCPSHGEFSVVASRLIRASTEDPCPACCLEKKPLTTAEFVVRAISKHGDTYDYSNVAYTLAHAKVEIICRTHGPFWQNAYQHLYGHGCPDCGKGMWAAKRKADASDRFPVAAAELYNGAYLYDKVEYQGVNTPVTVVCPEHGEFLVTPGGHLHGAGCRKCSSGRSQPEKDLSEFLDELGVQHELRDRTVIRPAELDIVVPDRKIAIEYCGLYWHRSENPKTTGRRSTAGIKDLSYHVKKLESCQQAGYRLITLFEDEWLESRKVVEQVLSRMLIPGRLKRIGSRVCTAVKISSDKAREFYSVHHLHGFTGAVLHIGLESSGELQAVGSFSTKRVIFGGAKTDGEFELVRFAQRWDTVVHGALNKLISKFASEVPEATSLVSYIDRRWFTGESYKSAGFSLVNVSKPGYWYTLGQSRYNRFSFAKHTLAKKLATYDDSLSEKDNMLANGYSVIHDCGTIKMIKHL